MPEYESSSWETATHVANADRSIVRKVSDRTEWVVQVESDFWVNQDACKSFGFEPVKEKKWEWKVEQQLRESTNNIWIREGTRTVRYFFEDDKQLAEKICRLLNEEGSVT